MALKDCINAVKKAAGRDDLTEAELSELSKTVANIVRRVKNSNVEDTESAVLRALDEFSDDLVSAAFVEKRNAAINLRSKISLEDYLTTVWGDAPDVGLLGFLGGVATPRKGARDSVDLAQTSLANSYIGGILARLEKDDLHGVFASGELDKEIWKAAYALNRKIPDEAALKKLPNEAVKIARLVVEYNEAARIDANNAGAWIKKAEGRVVKQTHNMYKIKNEGREAWTKFARDNLDNDRTFADVDDPGKMLTEMYSEFASGVHVHFQEGGMSGFKGFGNIGKKMSHERVLFFKDAEAEFEYNRRFGSGSLAQATLNGLTQMADQIGIMRKLGPNADANLQEVMGKIAKRLKKEADPKKSNAFEDRVNKVNKHLWPTISGQTKIPGNHMGAQIDSGVRNVMQMSKLGFAVQSSVADLAFYGSELSYQGGSMLGGVAEALGGLVSGRRTAGQKEIIGMLGVFYDGMRGSVISRNDAAAGTPGLLTSLAQKYFKINFLQWWTDKLRTTFALSRAHGLALNAGKSYTDLRAGLRRTLNLFGIDEPKWDLLRKGKSNEADGRAYLTPEAVNTLPDEAFAEYFKTVGRKFNKTSVRKLKVDLQDQFRAYYQDRATMAVIEPDARTRAILLRGTNPGTVEGTFFRQIALFKSFTTAVVQKPLAREIHGRSPEVSSTFQKLMKNGNGELAGLAQLLVWNTIFGYGAMVLKDLSKGKVPRDPSDWRTWMAALVQGGGGSVYGDFLFGDMKNRYGGGPASTLLGPAAGTAGDILDIIQRARDGDPVAAKAFRTLTNNTPYLNLFYTKWALDYLFLWRISESLSPGYLRRLEQRTKKNTEQEYMLSPSKAVSRGR